MTFLSNLLNKLVWPGWSLEKSSTRFTQSSGFPCLPPLHSHGKFLHNSTKKISLPLKIKILVGWMLACCSARLRLSIAWRVPVLKLIFRFNTFVLAVFVQQMWWGSQQRSQSLTHQLLNTNLTRDLPCVPAANSKLLDQDWLPQIVICNGISFVLGVGGGRSV